MQIDGGARDNELAKASANDNDASAYGRQLLILIDGPFSSRLSRYKKPK
jgi:hypothetical protein